MYVCSECDGCSLHAKKLQLFQNMIKKLINLQFYVMTLDLQMSDFFHETFQIIENHYNEESGVLGITKIVHILINL